MSKSRRRKQRQLQTRQQQPDAQKDYGTFWGAGTSGLFTGAGVSGRNTNLTRTEWGAATAYQIVPEVNRAISLRTAAISALNWEIVKKDKDGNEVVLCTQEDTQPEHPLARAFNATYDYSNQSIIALMAYSHDLVGEVFVQKTWTEETGRGLFWLNPLGTEPIIAGRIVSFQYTSMDGAQSEILKPNEVAYYHNRSPYSNFRGLGLTQVVMQKINMARNLDDFIEDFFNNNARPSVLVSPQGDMPFTDQQITQLQQQLDNFLKGRGNNWSTYVSKVGAKFTPMDQPNIGDHYGIAPVLSRYIYTVYGVPLAIAGDDSGTQYKTGDDVQVAFYQNTIIPLARELAKYINTQIMPYFDNSGAFFRFDTSEFDLVSADDDLRSQIATRNLQAGLWTRNRALEYTKETEIPSIDFMMINGVPIPLKQVPEYWKYSVLVAPSVYNSEIITGEPLPQPANPDQVIPDNTGGDTVAPSVVDDPKDVNNQTQNIPGKATQTTAADELRAWEKKTSKNWKAKFEPLHTRGDLADYVISALTTTNGDASAVKAVFAEAAKRLARKAIADTKSAFIDDFNGLLANARDGSIDRRTFSTTLRVLLNRFGRAAYKDGLEDGGTDPEELDDSDRANIGELLADQSKYVTEIGATLFKDGGVTDAQADIKGDLWFNKSITPFYNKGLQSANDNAMVEFGGESGEESCIQCTKLMGQRHRLKEFAKRELIPPGDSEHFDCGGWQCNHILIPVKGRARGNWLG